MWIIRLYYLYTGWRKQDGGVKLTSVAVVGTKQLFWANDSVERTGIFCND